MAGPGGRAGSRGRVPYHGRVKVSTRGDYASRALLSLALHRESGPTSVRDIAQRTGGYVLAASPADITLGQIVSAVEGPIAVGDFGEPHQNGACDHEGQCVLLQVWSDVGELMRHHLDSFTLEDMVLRARGLRPATALT